MELLSSTAALLIIAAYVTSTISGVMGMAGGILLLSVMTTVFPPAVLIPVHGVVQLGSNFTRVLVNLKSVSVKMIVPFALGAVAGALSGSRIVVALPQSTYGLVLGGFILVLTWMPRIKSVPPVPGKFALLGGVSTFLSLFIGATGPLLAPFFLHERLTKEQLIATKAACQATVHLFKVITFVTIGFAFSEYASLLAAMLFAVFLGSVTGKYLLGKFPEKWFRVIFKALITVLSLRMIYLSLV